MTASDDTRAGLYEAVDAVYAARDRDDMAPTIAAFQALLQQYPGDALALYELGGAYDTAGQEAPAALYYEQALAAGLDGTELRRCLLQYGSTLRNLGRLDEAIAAFERALTEFPGSRSVRAFLALALHSAGRSDLAVATLVQLVVEAGPQSEVDRYAVALTGYAAELADRDPLARRGAADPARPPARGGPPARPV